MKSPTTRSKHICGASVARLCAHCTAQQSYDGKHYEVRKNGVVIYEGIDAQASKQAYANAKKELADA